MLRYIVIILLIIFFIYMVVWSFNLHFHFKRQEKVNRVRTLRAKAEAPQAEAEAVRAEVREAMAAIQAEETESRSYWFNRRDLELSGEEVDIAKCFHYFSTVEEGVHDLLLEMYDYGIVRVDELEQIAYGDDHLKDVDLSFLNDLEREPESEQEETEQGGEPQKEARVLDEDVIQVEGMDFLFKKPTDVLDAAKNLDKDDPGIKDIRGTLSDGVEKVIEAVDKEKEIEAKKNEPIVEKQEESVEEARRKRERTSSQDIRSQVFDRWSRYVFELYEMVEINADEETKKRVRKGLHDYGFNDVEVLLKSPE